MSAATQMRPWLLSLFLLMALANSNGYTATSSQREESHSVINFKTGYSNSIHNSGSLLIFDQNDQTPQNPHPQQHGYTIWEDDYDPIQNYQNQLNPQRTASNSRLLQDIDSVDQCGNAFGWPDLDEANAIPTSGTNREFGTQEACSNKRPLTVTFFFFFLLPSDSLSSKFFCFFSTKEPLNRKIIYLCFTALLAARCDCDFQTKYVLGNVKFTSLICLCFLFHLSIDLGAWCDCWTVDPAAPINMDSI